MAVTLGEVLVRFGANTAGFESGIAGMTMRLNSFGDKAKAVGGIVAIAFVGAAVGIGIASTKMAADYEQAMTRVKVQAAPATENMQRLNQAILQMAPAVGQAPLKLAEGLYNIESAGIHGTAAIDALRYSAEAASTGGVKDLMIVTDATSTAIHDFGRYGITASQAVDVMSATVAQGKTQWDEYARAAGLLDARVNSMGGTFVEVNGKLKELPATAKQMSDGFYEANAAMALYTKSGISARQASQWVGSEFMYLTNQEVKMADNAHKLGIEFDTQKFSAMNLGDKIKYLGDITGGNLSEVQKLMGGNKTLAQTWEKLYQNAGEYNQILGNLRSSSGATDAKFAESAKGFNISMDRMRAGLDVVMIAIGTKFLPILSNIVNAVTPILGTFASWVMSGNFVGNAMKAIGDHAQVAIPILAALAVVIGGGLAVAMWSLASAVIAATWPILLIAAIVAAAAAIFVHFYTTNAGFKNFIDNVAKGFLQVAQFVQANFIPAMQQVGNWLKTTVLPILQQIGAFLLSAFAPAWQQMVDVWNSNILPALHQLWGALQPLMPVLMALAGIVIAVVIVAFGLLVGVLTGIVRGLAAFLGGLAIVIGGVVQVFTGIVQIVSGVVTLIYDIITGNFDKLGADLGMIWQGILNVISGVWNIIVGIFIAVFGTIWGIVSGFVEGVIGFFVHLYHALVGGSIIPDMVNGIVNWISQLPGRIGAIISQLVSWVVNAFLSLAQQARDKAQQLVSGVISQIQQLPGKAIGWMNNLASTVLGALRSLAGQALSAGANIVANIASGILGNIAGALGNAMGAVGNFISQHLPHSPARLGPLRDLQLQGTLIADQISTGMIAGMPRLQDSLNRVLRMPTGIGNMITTSQPIPTTSQAGNTTVNLIVDGRQLGQAVMQGAVNTIHLQTGRY